MRKIIYVILVLVLIAGLVYSITGINGIQGNVVKEQQIKIGGLFHLSGPGSFWGEGELNGAQMALDELKEQGFLIEFIIEDGETNFPKTANAIQKLVHVDGVDFIIGPTWFGQVASPLAEELRVLMISPSAGVVPKPNPYFFDVWPTERQEIIPIISHMQQHNIKKIALVYSLNDWSESMKNNFLAEANLQGIKVIEIFPTEPDEDDFRTLLTKIDNLNPDAIYAPFAFYPSQGAFSKQRKQLNLDITLYSSSGTENPLLLRAFPEIEGTLYPYPEKGPKEKEFAMRYKEKYGIEPSPPAAYSYDSMMLIYEAFRSGAQTPEEVSAFLHAMENYQGVSNMIDFDTNGRINSKSHIMKQVRNGKFVELR